MLSPAPSYNGTPFLTIPSSGAPLRLLMPTVRLPRSPSSTPGSPVSPPKSPKIKQPATKLMRSRSASTSTHVSPEIPCTPKSVGLQWFGKTCKFEIVQDQLEVEGYQLYAVEKWVTGRARAVVTLTVYTGDPSHKITVTALSPSSFLTAGEAEAEWNKVVRDLRQDGARPKETGRGTLMVTSLANFRSDFTIVHIPSGQFLEARERLYTNINLLRMGCSGRSALTLEEPSDTTKDRFIGMYHVQDKVRSAELFSATTIELVKLVQAGISVFGMFDLAPEEQNGLLCDVTVEGLQRWIAEIGEPLIGVEPMERIADPSIVSALLSIVACTRLKLYALGFNQLPKDPFLEPQAMVQGVHSFCNARTSFSGTAYTKLSFVTLELLETVNAAYEKFRQSESYKVHRVLLNKLDDLTTDLRTASPLGNSSSQIPEPTTDLGLLVKIILSHGKEATASLRYLWTGRPLLLARRRRERLGLAAVSDAEDEERERTDGKSTEDEADLNRWSSKRVQRKIESWTGLNRSKKQSADFSAKPSSLRPSSVTGSYGHQRSPSVPHVIVSRDQGDEEEILSSGQISPISQHNMYPGASLTPGDNMVFSRNDDYERRIYEFDRKRARTRPVTQNRITSWADPLSARGIAASESSLRKLGSTDMLAGGSRDDISKDDLSVHERTAKKPAGPQLTRRRSFDDASRLAQMRVLPLERMKIDVDLCGQLLIMRRRERHLEGAVACLQILTAMLADTNARLREDYEGHHQALADAEARAKVIAEIESASNKADAMMQEAYALSYESEQFHVPGLWHNVYPQRHKVLALREQVFGLGRRNGVPGRFNRVQWMLDGKERMVDRLGRTEAEAEEEHGLPEVVVDEDEEETVESQFMKPTWLLKFFESWGTRWGGGRGKQAAAKPSDDAKDAKQQQQQQQSQEDAKKAQDVTKSPGTESPAEPVAAASPSSPESRAPPPPIPVQSSD
ncbi:hypothetical protein DENSPDRAFT_831206 [Dentipellis sp. KUC8613]|nr:hypothetical protein DENSPDRAFT_831206 [Dentipellis sp. KUC8613]